MCFIIVLRMTPCASGVKFLLWGKNWGKMWGMGKNTIEKHSILGWYWVLLSYAIVLCRMSVFLAFSLLSLILRRRKEYLYVMINSCSLPMNVDIFAVYP